MNTLMDDFSQLDGLNDGNEDRNKDDDLFSRKNKEMNNWFDVERTKNTSIVVTEYTLSSLNTDVSILLLFT